MRKILTALFFVSLLVTTVAQAKTPATGPGSPTAPGLGNSVNLSNPNNIGILPTTSGGTGLSTLGDAEQCLKINEAGTAYEFGECGGAAVDPQALTITGGAFTIDASTGNYFSVTLNAATIVANAPTNPADGQNLIIEITQDATGNRTVSWNAAFSFGSGSAPTLTISPAAVDLVGFVYSSRKSKWLYVGAQLGY